MVARDRKRTAHLISVDAMYLTTVLLPIEKSLLFLSVVMIFFIRGNALEGTLPSITVLIGPVFTLWFLAAHFRHRQRDYLHISKISPLYGALFVVVVINIMLNAIWHAEYLGLIAQFAVEMAFSLFLVYAIFSHAKIPGTITSIFSFIQIGAWFVAVPIFMMASRMQAVRRIGAGADADYILPLAVNHIGHAMSIACMISVYRATTSWQTHHGIVNRRFVIHVICSVLTFTAMILTGSKAALLGFLLFAALLLTTFRRVRAKQLIVISIIALVAGSAIFVHSESGKYDALKDRFSQERLAAAFDDRAESYSRALENVRAQDMLFGMPWRYSLLNNTDGIPYPHNILLSFLLHLGVLPALLLLLIILRNYARLAAIVINRSNQLLAVTMLAIYSMVVQYMMGGGRITRVMTIFVVFGIVERYLSAHRSREFQHGV